MSDTINDTPTVIDQQQLAQELVEAARADGVELVGPGGLLTGLTKTVLETALEAEMSEHLGYDKHDPSGRNRADTDEPFVKRARRIVRVAVGDHGCERPGCGAVGVCARGSACRCTTRCRG